MDSNGDIIKVTYSERAHQTWIFDVILFIISLVETEIRLKKQKNKNLIIKFFLFTQYLKILFFSHFPKSPFSFF